VLSNVEALLNAVESPSTPLSSTPLSSSPSTKIDVVVDLIDSVGDKAALLMECRRRRVPLVVCGGAGGKKDPTRVRVCDIARCTNDKLVKQLRKLLRQKHGFPSEVVGVVPDPWGVLTVFGDERAVASQAPNEGTGCDGAFGTACFVTGAFGFAAAAAAVDVVTGRRGHCEVDFSGIEVQLEREARGTARLQKNELSTYGKKKTAQVATAIPE